MNANATQFPTGAIIRFAADDTTKIGYITGRDAATGQLRVCTAPGEYHGVDPTTATVIE